jgi:hypothetical protein
MAHTFQHEFFFVSVMANSIPCAGAVTERYAKSWEQLTGINAYTSIPVYYLPLLVKRDYPLKVDMYNKQYTMFSKTQQ